MKGRNSRLDEIQAAILRVKLKHITRWNESRHQKAAIYNEFFLKSGLRDKINIPEIDEQVKHVFHLYVIRAKQRDELFNFLMSKEISTGVHYPLPLHLQEVYKDRGYAPGDFPNAELVSKKVMSLPIYPELSKDNISYIVSSIGEFYSREKTRCGQ